MICSDRPSVLHATPLSPWLDGIFTGGPDLLSPDDILETQRGTVVHDPLSNAATALRSHLYEGPESVIVNRGYQTKTDKQRVNTHTTS